MKEEVTPIPREILKDLQYDLIDVKLFQKDVLDRSDFILLNSYNSNQEKVEILMELMREKSEKDHNNFLAVIEEDYKWLRDKCEIFLQRIRLDALLKATKGSTAPPSLEKTGVKQESPSIEENDRSSAPPKKQCTSSPDSTAVPARIIEDTFATPTQYEKNVITPLSNGARDIINSSVKIEPKLNQIITAQIMTVVRRNHRVVRKWSTLAHILGMTSIVHTLRMRMVMNGEDADACVLHLLEEWKGARPKEATLGTLVEALREEDFNDVADELEEKFAS